MPERLGRYVLDRKIATGGMADVFLARQAGQGGFEKTCVVKRMLPHLAADRQFVLMFLDEARLVAQLDHPHIAQIFDFGEVEGTYFLAMEHVAGADLREVVKAHAKRALRLPDAAAARLVSQAAQALHYAHRAIGIDRKPLGIVHRDVNPQNILLGQTGLVKLIDFGVAKAEAAYHRTAAGLIKGKFAYMSPEQLRGKPLDARSDLYALGLVLYELLTLTRAIEGQNDVAVMQAAAKQQMVPLSERRPDVPPSLRAIVEKCLQKDRDARYSSGAQLSEDLERFISSGASPVTGADLARLLPEGARADEAQAPSSANRLAVQPQPAPANFWDNPSAALTALGDPKADLPRTDPDRPAALAATGPAPAKEDPLERLREDPSDPESGDDVTESLETVTARAGPSARTLRIAPPAKSRRRTALLALAALGLAALGAALLMIR